MFEIILLLKLHSTNERKFFLRRGWNVFDFEEGCWIRGFFNCAVEFNTTTTKKTVWIPFSSLRLYPFRILAIIITIYLVVDIPKMLQRSHIEPVGQVFKSGYSFFSLGFFILSPFFPELVGVFFTSLMSHHVTKVLQFFTVQWIFSAPFGLESKWGKMFLILTKLNQINWKHYDMIVAEKLLDFPMIVKLFNQ